MPVDKEKWSPKKLSLAALLFCLGGIFLGVVYYNINQRSLNNCTYGYGCIGIGVKVFFISLFIALPFEATALVLALKSLVKIMHESTQTKPNKVNLSSEHPDNDQQQPQAKT